MKNYIKISIRNIKNNKMKYILVSLVFMLSIFSGIFSTSFSDIAVKTREKQLRVNTLNTQVAIISKDEKNIYFSEDIINKIINIDGIKEICKRLSGIAKIDNNSINFIGIEEEKQSKVLDFNFLEKIGKEESYAYVDENFLKKYSKKIGDKLKLTVENKSIDVKITGILSNEAGLDDSTIYISLKDAQKLLDKEKNITCLGITIKNLNDIDEVYNSVISKISSDLIAEKRYDMSDYESYVSTIVIAMGILCIFSIIISIILCYSVFKSMIYQRIRTIGSYRSIGITKGGIYLSLIFELIISLIPAIILGILLTYLLMKNLINGILESNVSLKIDFLNIIVVVGIIFITGVLSLVIAVRKILNMSIIELIKGNTNIDKYKNKLMGLIIRIVGVIMIFITYFYSKKENDIKLQYILMILILLNFALFSSFIIKVILKFLSFFSSKINKNLYLAIKEMYTKVFQLKESILLIILVIAISSISITIHNVVENSSINVYSSIDIILNNLTVDCNDKITSLLKDIDEIESITTIDRYSEKVLDRQITISGIVPEEYVNIAFEKFISEDKESMLKKLENEENSIIITKTLANYLDKNINDTIDISTIKGIVRFKIIGIISSFEDKGNVTFISKKYFNKYFLPDYTSYLISTLSDSNDKIVDNIITIINDEAYYNISTLKQMREQNEKDNSIIFAIVNIVIIITLIVCSISLINNLVINIIKRRKVIAIQRTLGAELTFIRNLLLLEGGILGFFSSFIGLILGWIINNNIINILSYYLGDFEIGTIIPPLWFIIIAMFLVAICYMYPYRIIKKSNLVSIVKGDE